MDTKKNTGKYHHLIKLKQKTYALKHLCVHTHTYKLAAIYNVIVCPDFSGVWCGFFFKQKSFGI